MFLYRHPVANSSMKNNIAVFSGVCVCVGERGAARGSRMGGVRKILCDGNNLSKLYKVSVMILSLSLGIISPWHSAF